METRVLVTENWLTRKPAPLAGAVTWFLGLFLFVTSFMFLNGQLGADLWMPASREAVFQSHEYWRLWTTLFAHADLGHLLSNTMLFIPFAYFLSSYYGPFFFPLFGLLMGGAINWVVLQTMPATVGLIGISGVVSWMGAAWLTLFLLVENRASLRRRLAIVFLLSFVLFAPETYKREVSYISHLVGFVFGVFSGIGYYLLNRRRFLAAVVTETIIEDDELWPSHDASAPSSEVQIQSSEGLAAGSVAAAADSSELRATSSK